MLVAEATAQGRLAATNLLLLRLSFRRGTLALLLDGGLRGGEAGDGDAVGRAAHVVQADAVAELHGIRFAAVFAADAGLDAGPRLVALLDRDLHGIGRTTRLPERVSRPKQPTPVWSSEMKRGCPPDLLLHDLEFGVAGQEAAGVVTERAGLRKVIAAEAEELGGVRLGKNLHGLAFELKCRLPFSSQMDIFSQ